jgi:hypothetical protein
MAVCSEIHTKHINTLCGQKVEFVNAKPAGTYSNRRALEVRGTAVSHALTFRNFVFCSGLFSDYGDCFEKHY